MDLAKENPKTAACVAFFVAILAIGVVAGAYFHSSYILRASKRQQETQATIYMIVNGRAGETYFYQFTAAGSSENHGQSHSPNDHHFIGQQVRVFFDPKYPTANSVSRFSPNPLPDMIAILLATCFGVAALIYGVILWRRTPVRA